MSLKSYFAITAATTSAAVGLAWQNHHQFYTACLALTQGKASQLVVANTFVAIALIIGMVLKKLTLGTLRATEFEHLTDRLWPTVFDTLLLTTIFREELTPSFFLLFGLLVFFSVFHRLAKDRVDYIATSPIMSAFSYVRLLALLIFLIAVDVVYVFLVYDLVSSYGTSYLLLFGFEYALLLWSVKCSTMKLFLHLIDMRLDGQWYNKAAYILVVEFVEEAQKAITLVFFFLTILAQYGVPLHILRRLIGSAQRFSKKASDVYLYFHMARNINRLIQNATPEDLERDNMCVICRDDMVEGKKLPCGHIFHSACLRGWLGRSQECPTCRHPLLGRRPNARAAEDRRMRQLAAQQQMQQRFAMAQQAQQAQQAWNEAVRMQGAPQGVHGQHQVPQAAQQPPQQPLQQRPPAHVQPRDQQRPQTQAEPQRAQPSQPSSPALHRPAVQQRAARGYAAATGQSAPLEELAGLIGEVDVVLRDLEGTHQTLGILQKRMQSILAAAVAEGALDTPAEVADVKHEADRGNVDAKQEEAEADVWEAEEQAALQESVKEEKFESAEEVIPPASPAASQGDFEEDLEGLDEAEKLRRLRVRRFSAQRGSQ